MEISLIRKLKNKKLGTKFIKIEKLIWKIFHVKLKRQSYNKQRKKNENIRDKRW
jgi:hypothetical protein